ncbi:MAG: LemA family protein [Clostridia bacterium]|nr:LemA family protein [Clostridia bacterium]
MTNILLLSTGAIIGIVVAVVLVLVLVIAVAAWYISAYNKLQRLKNLVEEGWHTIEVQLKKRYDLIPNLVETVKGYAKHESGTLEAVIAARNAAMTATGDGKIEAENALNGTLKSLFALKEAYPELKANTNFLDLQNQLKGIENEIASARRYYNGTVKELNTRIDIFPSSIVARRMRLEKRSYFEIENAEERNAPQVKF